MSHASKEFTPLNIAVLTLSDTRTLEVDTSGQFLADNLQEAGHKLGDRVLIPDDIYQMRAVVSKWIADPAINAVLITGGTGFTDRDNTPDALKPLFDKEVDGFGELFRYLTFKELGSSTVQSRAIGGMANHTVIFCMPGSTGACRTGWNGIIKEQLDSRHKPCNFVPHMNLAENCESRG
jgi:molybdenum cofactor biosynthesis protein B